MRRHIYSEVASNDIDAVIDLIKAANPSAAKKWFSKIEAKCRRLAQFPNIGKQRDDLRDGVYCFPCDKYLIFYDITDTAVIIVHVVHGARNLLDVFRTGEAEE